jgi:hypothetical protein
VAGESVLYVGWGCAVCEPVAHWIARRDPVGLRLAGAGDWPGETPLRRITYAAPDGYRVDGVRAVGRALEHLNLGWAWLGWIVRMPVIAPVLQIVLDATGAGPRTVPSAREGNTPPADGESGVAAGTVNGPSRAGGRTWHEDAGQALADVGLRGREHH